MTVRYSKDFAKTAGAWDSFKSLATHPGVVIPTAATAAGFGLNAMRDVLSDAMEARRKAQAFKGMIAAHPSLKRRDQKDVRNIYNSVYNINPHMAKDPLVAGAIVDRIYQRQEGFGGRDATSNQGLLETAQELAGIRNQLSAARSTESKGKRDFLPLTQAFGSSVKDTAAALESRIGEVGALRQQLADMREDNAKRAREKALNDFSKSTGGKQPTPEVLRDIMAAAHAAGDPRVQQADRVLRAMQDRNRARTVHGVIKNQAPARPDPRPSRYGDVGRAVEDAFNQLRRNRR